MNLIVIRTNSYHRPVSIPGETGDSLRFGCELLLMDAHAATEQGND
jgi:hypothetical protein